VPEDQFAQPGYTPPLGPPSPLFASVGRSVQPVHVRYGRLPRVLLYEESERNKWWQSVYGELPVLVKPYEDGQECSRL
jgi:hypothetical protein